MSYTRQNISSGSPFEPRIGISRAVRLVQVSRFIDPDWLVEIEADAVVQPQGGV